MNSEQTSSKKGLWLIIIVIILILLALAYWQTHLRQKVTKIDDNQTLTTAPEGKTVSGFPADLIQEQNTAIGQSFGLNYKDSGISQPVVQYASKRGLEDNVVIYRQYLSNNNWLITHEANPNENPTFFYATKDNSQVNITFVESNGQVNVTIAYANKA